MRCVPRTVRSDMSKQSTKGNDSVREYPLPVLPPGRDRKTRARLPTITPTTPPPILQEPHLSLPSCAVLAGEKDRRDQGQVMVYEQYKCMCCEETFHTVEPFRRHVYKHFARRAQVSRNRLNQEILLHDWLITSHVLIGYCINVSHDQLLEMYTVRN